MGLEKRLKKVSDLLPTKIVTAELCVGKKSEDVMFVIAFKQAKKAIFMSGLVLLRGCISSLPFGMTKTSESR